MQHRKILLFTGIILFELLGNAQIKEIGLPFIDSYSNEIYNAGNQNWAITQDSDGLLYFANNEGVLRFDGTSWSLFVLPNNSKVRSVKWIDNKLYAGGWDEFGYFAKDQTGSTSYHSISDKLSGEQKNFGEIWRIFQTEHGIVFQSFLHIFLNKDDEFTVLSPKSVFGFSYYSNNNLFIIDRDYGLSILKSDGVSPVYADAEFFRKNEISFIISRGLSDYLIGTTNNGIYQFNGTALSPWEAEINERFKDEQIYTGLKLKHEQIAIGTIQNGIYIIDGQGRLIQHLNRTNGLQNNTVLSLLQDRQENLWLGLDNGIDALEVSSPISNLNYFYGIETSYVSRVFKGLLYIGTNQGLFARPMDEIENSFMEESSFQLVEGVVGQVWSLAEFKGKLLCGNNLGTFQVDAYSSVQISDRQGGWGYVSVPGREGIIVGGTYNGLQLFRYNGSSPRGWKEDEAIEGLSESCKEFLFDEQGNLWISHEYEGIFKLKLSQDLHRADSVARYNKSGGLPELPYSISRLDGELVVVSREGIYSYDQALDTFLLHTEYHSLLQDEPGLTKVKEDSLGDLWFFSTHRMGVLRKQEDGTYTKMIKPFKRISKEFLGSTSENVFVYDQENVFIGGVRGMFHYNPSKQKDFEGGGKIFISRVELQGKQSDSIIYHEGSIDSRYQVPFRFNSLSFHFFAPYFEAPGHISYSHKLDGFDEKWSDWESRDIKEYTNLHEGDYEFHVQAMNIYGNVAGPASIKISINPPFYRTTLAFVLYLLLFILVAILLVYLVRKRIGRAREQDKVLHEKELQAQEETYKEGVKVSNQEIERLKNERLIIEMRHKDMELANSTMYLVQKNKFLNKLKSEIQDLIGKLSHESNKHSLRQIVHRIDRDIKSKQHWKVFDQYFDEVHEDFLARLKEKHPDLTPKDLRLCAYLRMNISTKEIAPLMNISIRGVEISRYRLRKKLDLDQNTNLTEYILGI